MRSYQHRVDEEFLNQELAGRWNDDVNRMRAVFGSQPSVEFNLSTALPPSNHRSWPGRQGVVLAIKNIDASEVVDRIQRHELWLDSAGREGEQLDLAVHDLSHVSLRGAMLLGAELASSSFVGSDLAGANLARTSLSGADLSRADLSGASLVKAEAGHCVAQHTNFRGADLLRVDFYQSNMQGADFTGCEMTKAVFAHCDLSRAVFAGCRLDRVAFEGARLVDAVFSGATIVEPIIASWIIVSDGDQEVRLEGDQVLNWLRGHA
jgi:uncharacterized protein YjbI with pentapeptide repeats